MAKYILRLDDICPTMDKTKWDRIEKICDKYNIKPIIAVVPDNKDEKLIKNEFDDNFWDKVRNWQKKGWYIALHGYNHVYETKESGFLPFNKKSEFAGFPYEKQAEKIKKAWEILKKEKIKCNIWVAPAHTFDKNTLKALNNYTSIEIISDGIGMFSFKKYGFNWIPQQLWRFRRMPFGVWTACFHPNEMSENDFKKLENFIRKNKENFINLDKLKYKKNCILNNIFYLLYLILFKIKRLKKNANNK